MRNVLWLAGVAICGMGLLAGGCGPVHNPNYAQLRINAEPQGSRVYSNGQFMGTTPCDLTYTIDEHNYKSGVCNCAEIVVVADGCLAQRASPRLKVESSWRPDTSQYFSGGNCWYYGHLFILERDPSAPQVHRYDITRRQEESDLDKATKAANLMLMLKAISGR